VELVVPEDCEIPQAGETVDVEVPEGEYVLWAAREAGVWLPADCQQGWCCRCAGELLSGELDQTDARRYFETDRDAALHLLCTAVPSPTAGFGSASTRRCSTNAPNRNCRLATRSGNYFSRRLPELWTCSRGSRTSSG